MATAHLPAYSVFGCTAPKLTQVTETQKHFRPLTERERVAVFAAMHRCHKLGRHIELSHAVVEDLARRGWHGVTEAMVDDAMYCRIDGLERAKAMRRSGNLHIDAECERLERAAFTEREVR